MTAITKATTEDEIERRVDAWHKGAGDGLELPEYLGWTEAEYRAWLLDHDKIPLKQADES